MGPDFIPIPTTEGWQLSNAPVLLMAPLRASLEIFHQAGIARLREKSLSLTGTLFTYLNNSERFTQLGLKILTPDIASERGCQISIQTGSNGKDLFNKLSASGIICDWREPDVIRIAPVPLYNSFEDVYRFAQILLN
jgi:kynureninase